jgi:hypothetical protein
VPAARELIIAAVYRDPQAATKTEILDAAWDLVREHAPRAAGGSASSAWATSCTAPAGGSYASGTDGSALDIDATDWAWTISGRARGSGLLANPLPL